MCSQEKYLQMTAWKTSNSADTLINVVDANVNLKNRLSVPDASMTSKYRNETRAKLVSKERSGNSKRYVARIKALAPVYFVMDSPMGASKGNILKKFKFRCGRRLRRKGTVSDPRSPAGP